MSTITKEFTKEQLQQIEAAAKEVLWPVVWSEKKAREHFSEKITPKVVLKLARIALASLEAEAVCVIDQTNLDYLKSGADADVWPASRAEMGDVLLYRAALPAPANADPVAWMWSHRKHPSEVTLVRPEDDEQAEGAHWSGWSCQALYAAPPAPVSVPDDEQCKPHPVMAVKGELGFLDHFERIIDERDDDIEIGRLSSSNGEALMLAALDAFRASIQKGVEPVTIKANGGGYENDEPPERGWVVTHSGKDYFYREQGDAATHMNAAVESGIGVSLRSFIPEPVTTAYKLPDDFDFDRFNDVVWLEAVASNPHMHSPITSTIAMVALELNKRLEAGNSPVIPDGLRLALSNAGIAAPESDEMLAATCEKYIQALVTWVKDRKPFRSAVIPDGWVACSERMPEVGVKVLCFPVNDEPIHATYNGQVWLQDISWSTSDEPIDNVISCNVFHWMPLPAAPQQEVK